MLSMTKKDGKEFCSCLLGFVSTKNYMTAEMYNFFSISVSIGRQFCLLAIARNSGLDCEGLNLKCEMRGAYYYMRTYILLARRRTYY